jgi:uncharacterized protein YndB with AHSA1/START domain
VPTVRRARTIAARPEDVWNVISNPHHLPRWWPGVARVEEATPQAWTKVLTTKRGRGVRADYTRVRAERPRRLVWQQELVGSPFERLLSEARTTISLSSADGGGTRVEIEQAEKPRGMNRFGGFMFRMAARKRLDQALDGLDQILGEPG